jgi:ABC-type multidrug transport system ATPase subunit
MNEVLTTEGLCKNYRKQSALSGFNMKVLKGDIYGFIGNNGAGKTTLMKIIMGLSRESAGAFELFGVPRNKVDLSVRRRISAIIETPSFYPHVSGYQNLALHQLAIGQKVSRERIEHALETVGLLAENRKKASNYSLGMKQRLGIARALLADTDFVILDEPTNGLDPFGIRELRDLILRLNREKGTTFLISSHHISELSNMITKIGIIKKGRMVEEKEYALLQKEIDAKNITLEEYFLGLAN